MSDWVIGVIVFLLFVIVADGSMIGIGDEVIFIVGLLPLIFIPVYFLMYAMRNFFVRQTGNISNKYLLEPFTNFDLFQNPVCRLQMMALWICQENPSTTQTTRVPSA